MLEKGGQQQTPTKRQPQDISSQRRLHLLGTVLLELGRHDFQHGTEHAHCQGNGKIHQADDDADRYLLDDRKVLGILLVPLARPPDETGRGVYR